MRSEASRRIPDGRGVGWRRRVRRRLHERNRHDRHGDLHLCTAQAIERSTSANADTTLAATYYLTQDIDCTNFDAGDTTWGGFRPIGRRWSKPFKGILYGNQHRIDALNIQRGVTPDDWVGLFWQTSGATIQELRIEDSVIWGHNYVGAVAGSMTNTSVYLVTSSSSSFVAGTTFVGGIAGYTTNGSIVVSYAQNIFGGGTVTYERGLVGYVNGTAITDA